MEPQAFAAFLEEYDELKLQVAGTNAVLDATRLQLDAIKVALGRSDAADPQLHATAAGLQKQVLQLIEKMRGNQRRSRMNASEPVSVAQRLGVVRGGISRSTYGPTPMHLEQLEFGKEQFAGVRTELDVIVKQELPALERALDAAGVPWTPGRS